MEIKVVKDSILDSDVESIVNPANPQLLKGGGLSGIIHEAAGDDLFQYLRSWKIENNIPFIEHGNSIISPA